MSEDREKKAGEQIERAIGLERAGETLRALSFAEKAFELHPSPRARSVLGLLIAVERGLHLDGEALCREAVAEEPNVPEHHVRLGRVLIKAGRKVEAIDAFRDAIVAGPSEEAVRMLEGLGTRQEPVFSFLDRKNPVNRFIGLVLKRLGLR